MDYDYREVQLTPMLMVQKLRNLEPVPAFWSNCLMTGINCNGKIWQTAPYKDDLWSHFFSDWDGASNQLSSNKRGLSGIEEFWNKFKFLLPPTAQTKLSNPKSQVYVELPEIEECKQHFETQVPGFLMACSTRHQTKSLYELKTERMATVIDDDLLNQYLPKSFNGYNLKALLKTPPTVHSERWAAGYKGDTKKEVMMTIRRDHDYKPVDDEECPPAKEVEKSTNG